MEKMFFSDQYFGKGSQLDSYSTALEAAEDARGNLMSLQADQTVGIDDQGLTPDQIERDYRRTMVASALIIAWCAGGLVGESRQESACTIFRTSVAPPEVQSWGSFKKLLEKECEKYGAGVDPLGWTFLHFRTNRYQLCPENASRKRSGSDALLRKTVLTGQRGSLYVAKRRGYGTKPWKICRRKGDDVPSSRA
jgi:hypothetical protein